MGLFDQQTPQTMSGQVPQGPDAMNQLMQMAQSNPQILQEIASHNPQVAQMLIQKMQPQQTGQVFPEQPYMPIAQAPDNSMMPQPEEVPIPMEPTVQQTKSMEQKQQQAGQLDIRHYMKEAREYPETKAIFESLTKMNPDFAFLLNNKKG